MRVGVLQPGVRTARDRVRRHPWTTLCSWSSGAHRRYGLTVGWVPPLSTVLLRQRLPRRHADIVNLSLHLAITRRHFFQWLTTERQRPSDVTPSALTVRLLTANAGTPDANPSATRLLERIVARQRRRDMVTNEHFTSLRHLEHERVHDIGAVSSAATPIEFVLRRPRSDDNAAPQPPRNHGASMAVNSATPWRGASPGNAHAAASVPVIPLSPGELARLTDDVVRALDSRVIAYRERRGVI